MKETDFQENVVIITGASYGIGQELALQLAQKGAWLVLGARNAERLEEISRLYSLRTKKPNRHRACGQVEVVLGYCNFFIVDTGLAREVFTQLRFLFDRSIRDILNWYAHS